MQDFNFYNPTQIFFGKNKINLVGDLVSKNTKTKKILLVVSNSCKKNGVLELVKSKLDNIDVDYYIFDKIVSNPNMDYIDEAIDLLKNNNLDFVLAIGGASVIDTAKTICVAAYNQEDIWELICNPANIKGAIPLGVIITLYGSGTEMTNGAVITNTKIPKKRGFDSEFMYPKFSIMDPLALKSVDKEYLMIGATDIFIHTLEQYFEITNEDNLSDPYLELLSKQIVSEIVKFEDNSQNNENLFWLSTLAQNKFLTFGKGNNGEWVAHIISHEFCLKYNLPHGRVVSVLFLAWLRFIKHINEKRIIKFGVNVYNLENPTVDDVINSIENSLRILGNGNSLKNLGVKEEDLESLIFNATTGKKLGKNISLSIDDIKEIVSGGFYGY